MTKPSIENYAIHRDFVNYYLTEFPSSDFSKSIAILSQSRQVPCYVMAHYVGEVVGFTDEIKRIIQVIEDFYNYE